MSSFPVGIIITFFGCFLMACLPRCPNRRKIIWEVCRDSPVMHWPYVYLWRSERNVEYLWSYFLLLKGSTWTEIKLFPHKQNWSANGFLLCFRTPAVMWLYLKCDPGCHTDFWGCPERTLPSVPTADAAGAALAGPLSHVLRGGDVLCSPFLCPCLTGSWQDQQPAELRTFQLSSARVLESHLPWQGPAVGCGDEVERELNAGWLFMEAAYGHCSIKKPGAMQIGSAKQRGFINCAFITIAVSSTLSFSKNVLSHLHFVYKERCIFSGISVLLHFSDGLSCLIIFAICLCIWMFFFPHWWNFGAWIWQSKVFDNWILDQSWYFTKKLSRT